MIDDKDRLFWVGKFQDLFSHSQKPEKTREEIQVLKTSVSNFTFAFICYIPYI